MQRRSYYIINAITLYRLLVAPFLIFLVIEGHVELFRWLLAFSFLTDAVDGFLARRFGIVSAMGAKLDSIADDLTVTAGIIGVFLLEPRFVQQEWLLITVMLSLLFIQVTFAFLRYRKMTSFHTYIAKAAAVLQAVFLVLLFFTDDVPYTLFYFAAGFTIVNLLEEIIIICLLPKWKSDVRGLYWVLKARQKKNSIHHNPAA